MKLAWPTTEIQQGLATGSCKTLRTFQKLAMGPVIFDKEPWPIFTAAWPEPSGHPCVARTQRTSPEPTAKPNGIGGGTWSLPGSHLNPAGAHSGILQNPCGAFQKLAKEPAIFGRKP